MTDRINLKDKAGYTLRSVGHINVLLGKNGCGKSTLLKQVEQALAADRTRGGITRYITPERAGFLNYEPNIENNMLTIGTWLAESRRQNQFQSFKQQSVAHFRKLETMVLRQIEKDPVLRANSAFTFDTVIESVNTLLDNVVIRREGATFKLYSKQTAQNISAEHISSGESELISLAIECLLFERECVDGQDNILFLDEPDVHLHPDLQAQFGHFLIDELNKCRVIIATHSTAFLGAFSDYDGVAVAFMNRGANGKDFEFEKVTDVYRRVLPVFGAHPLSNLFNDVPIFLVEGEDDERVWQQAVRTSRKALKIYPCCVDSVDQLPKYEREVQKILLSVYDRPRGYSCRDGDGVAAPIDDLPPVVRFRLNCKSAENLLLTDDVLASLGVDWATLQARIENWLTINQGHPHFARMNDFKSEKFPRKEFNLKEIRNDILGLLNTTKSWEIAVGQVIAGLTRNPKPTDNSLQNYLGEKLVSALF